MKSIFDSVISRGDYSLPDMLAKIDRYHIEGRITDEEHAALYAAAREGVKPDYDVNAEIEKLWAAVRELKSAVSGEDADTDSEIGEYRDVTGAHDAHQPGYRYRDANGNVWECLLPNTAYPASIYPTAWKRVEV